MDTNFEILGEAFLEYLQMKNYTPSTRRTYRRALRKFFKFLDEQNLTSLDEITPKVLYEYQGALYYGHSVKNKPLSVFAQHSALSVVKTFFLFLCHTDRLAVNPAATLELPKKPQALPTSLSIAQVMKLLEQPEADSVIGFRDRTILEVFYGTGMRNSELCALRVYDVNVEAEEIVIREGKGHRQRIVPMTGIAAEYLREYLKVCRPKLVKDGGTFVFVSRRGRRMHPNDVTAMVAKYAKEAGLDGKVTAHKLRHTCATHLLKGGADIRYIQKLLGHQSIITTQGYTAVDVSDLKEIHRRYHPRENEE